MKRNTAGACHGQLGFLRHSAIASVKKLGFDVRVMILQWPLREEVAVVVKITKK